MEIGQRFLVIDPADLGHKALDEAKHALGAVDESPLYLARIRISVAVASLVEESLGARGVLWRRQIEKGEEVTRLVVRALLLKFGAALDVDQIRRHGGIQVRTPKLGGALKRTILVEDDSFVDQSRPGQEIHELRSGAAIF